MDLQKGSASKHMRWLRKDESIVENASKVNCAFYREEEVNYVDE